MIGLSSALSANDLQLQAGDAYIELNDEKDGFYLYIKAKEGLGSVLITESTADPRKDTDSFAFRAWDYNSVNGDEKRLLNGEFLDADPPLYFLIDSSPEPNALLDSTYRIYIPFLLTYGYPWSREGQVEMRQGTWFNVRTFEKPYADYEGEWQDNPFVLSMNAIPPAREPNPVTEPWPEPAPEPEPISYKKGPVKNTEEGVERIVNIINANKGSIDVVLVVDTTISMKNDISFIKEALVPLVRNTAANYTSLRVGLVLYKDYKEAYLTRSSEFTTDLNVLQERLNSITTAGGRDIEEAVNEGIYSALTEFDWQAEKRLIIQVGDALAHSKPRGEITREMVEQEALRQGISIHPVKLPDDA